MARDRGLDQIVLWPFGGKDGPMGKQPQLRAPSDQQAEMVACHPKQGVVAVGFADGLVLVVRIDDGAEVLGRKPGGSPVTALAWSAAASCSPSGRGGKAASSIWRLRSMCRVRGSHHRSPHRAGRPRQFPRLQARGGGRREDLDAIRGALQGAAELTDAGTAWISQDALRLRPEVAADTAWQQSFAAMIEKARPHGWIDDARKAIKAHVEWVG